MLFHLMFIPCEMSELVNANTVANPEFIGHKTLSAMLNFNLQSQTGDSWNPACAIWAVELAAIAGIGALSSLALYGLEKKSEKKEPTP